MRKTHVGLTCTAMAFITLLGANSAQAGAKITISDDSNFDLGFRVQALYLNNDKDRTTNEDEFKVRRARFRLKGNITKYVTGFLQTDFRDDDTSSGGDVRLIDSWVMVKPHKLLNIIGGQHMTAVTRMSMTSSGGLMAIDRPGINNYLLTWGTSGREAFNNGTLGGTSAGLKGDVNVRDLGFSLFGKTSFTDTAHFKYYLGVYEGQDTATRSNDTERYNARVQVNFFDAEPGLFNVSTYLGKKKTVAIGAGYDTQNSVAIDQNTGNTIDYTFFTLDAFTDYPVGSGYLTAEAAYNDLALDDAGILLQQKDASTNLSGTVQGKESQGSGFYAQIGYYINKWQPWIMYEQWESDGADDAGSWDAFRVGLNYYIKGHNANVKVAYETVNNDTPGEQNIDTFVLGFYLTY